MKQILNGSEKGRTGLCALAVNIQKLQGKHVHKNDIPEKDVCEKFGINMIFTFGGTEKSDSSTRINQELGLEEDS